MKATEQYFPVVLFITLYRVVLTFEFEKEILQCDVQMKAIQQYSPVVLCFYFILFYYYFFFCKKVVLTFKSVDDIPSYHAIQENVLTLSL